MRCSRFGWLTSRNLVQEACVLRYWHVPGRLRSHYHNGLHVSFISPTQCTSPALGWGRGVCWTCWHGVGLLCGAGAGCSGPLRFQVDSRWVEAEHQRGKLSSFFYFFVLCSAQFNRERSDIWACLRMSGANFIWRMARLCPAFLVSADIE